MANNEKKSKDSEVKLVGNNLIYSGQINNEGAMLFQEKAYTFLDQYKKCLEINRNVNDDANSSVNSGMNSRSDNKTKKETCNIDINQPLSVHITSGGGKVAQGIAMMNTIEELNQQIPTKCISKGFVGSAATYVAFSCNERCSGSNTQFLLHPPSKSGVSGQTSDLIMTAENSKRTYDNILNIYYRKSKIDTSAWEINKVFNDNSYSSAEDMKRMGLIDKILE